MVNNLKDYVFAVCDGESESAFRGTAFVINNYIITAGHVNPPVRVFHLFDGTKYVELYPMCFGIKHFSPEKSKLDFTAYPIKNIESPFELATDLPPCGSDMQIICWQKNNGNLEQLICKCTIRGFDSEKNRFYAYLHGKISHGSSGCPIFMENQVYGILTDGYDKEKRPLLTESGQARLKDDIDKYGEEILDCCFFLPAKEIKKALLSQI